MVIWIFKNNLLVFYTLISEIRRIEKKHIMNLGIENTAGRFGTNIIPLKTSETPRPINLSEGIYIGLQRSDEVLLSTRKSLIAVLKRICGSIR